MKMYQIENNVVSLNLKANMNKRQMRIFNSLGESDQLNYLRSFNGAPINISELRDRRCEMKNFTDKLVRKANNSILNTLRRMKNCSESHSPTEIKKGHWVGIEIECLVPICANEYCDDCDSHDCGCYGSSDAEYEVAHWLNDLGVKRVSVKGDSSIDNDGDYDYSGVEIAILTTIDNLEVIEVVCDELNRRGAIVNHSCGLHVHLDVRDLKGDTDLILNRGYRLNNALPIMLAMQPESRRDNEYCQPEMGSITGGRYYAINMSSVEKFQTIEVRIHSSSTNSRKIIAWTRLLYQLSRCDGLDASKLESVEQLKGLLPLLPKSVYDYVVERVKKFSGYKVNQLKERVA